MPLLDVILDRTGAIGSRIRGYRLNAQRDTLIMRRPRSPVHTVIVTSDGKRLAFDAATDIGHQFPSKVTSYPVEDKSTVSDHIVNENPRFTVTGVFSDASAVGAANSAPTPFAYSPANLLNPPPPSSPVVRSSNERYTQSEVYAKLLKARDDRKVVTLLTPLDTFSDLAITNIGIPRKTAQGDALFVDIEFEKIRRVSSELSTVFVGSSSSNQNGDAVKKQEGNTATNNAKETNAAIKPPKTETSEGKPIEDVVIDKGIEFLGELSKIGSIL